MCWWWQGACLRREVFIDIFYYFFLSAVKRCADGTAARPEGTEEHQGCQVRVPYFKPIPLPGNKCASLQNNNYKSWEGVQENLWSQILLWVSVQWRKHRFAQPAMSGAHVAVGCLVDGWRARGSWLAQRPASGVKLWFKRE